jgi:LPXTG-motif cell wall-anchored protein
MKSAANIFGILLILVGAVFGLQGANILPGSVMTGDVKWLVIGIIMIIMGGGLIFWQRRQISSNSDS